MASVATREPLFRRGSSVHAYWLANSEGFALGRGRVETVVRGPEAATVDALVVRAGPLRRRRLVDAEAVAAVDPAQRVLLVDRRPRRKPRVRATIAQGRRDAAPYARAAAEATARGWAWTRPRAAHLLRVARLLALAAAARAARTLSVALALAAVGSLRGARALAAGLALAAVGSLRGARALAAGLGAAAARTASALAAAAEWLRPRLAEAATRSSVAARALAGELERERRRLRSRPGRRAPG